ncbi:N-formylglutamate amidohydrolase [Qipengyuania marisflavi]|uniref:N-formylglutamate amidohydrolase n=1 Tax=Qipengyuania marisflavi TaxID=2486356 RepID=A0A5S3P9B2_9SPHN|nr:N-formylglutamate amidohydrolase [Qipengyuania marisflavi]TMM50036.1 N-formylglutamate amidohydrolase [Qipengyuania marisflavi]
MIDGMPYRQVGEMRPGGLVCVADHASNHVPEAIQLGIDRSLLDDHIAVDIGVEGLADRLARRHEIPAHIATVSRLVCDFHRREDEPAVVPTQSDGHLIPGNIGADVENRLQQYHRPYHDALAAFLTAARPRLIVSLHSFTPSLATSDEPRPWEVALLYNHDDRAARHAIRLFAQQGLMVGDNQPYSGKQLNATMDRHAEAHGIPYCTVEIRQDQIASEAGQARWAVMIADVMGRVALEV